MPTSTSQSPAAQAAEDFHTLDGVDVAVQVADFEVQIAQVVREILGGAFGERGDEHALALFDALAAKLDGFVDLAFERLDGDDGIEQAGGADDLLDDERSGPWWSHRSSRPARSLPLTRMALPGKSGGNAHIGFLFGM
jgi:hypothetical protein